MSNRSLTLIYVLWIVSYNKRNCFAIFNGSASILVSMLGTLVPFSVEYLENKSISEVWWNKLFWQFLVSQKLSNVLLMFFRMREKSARNKPDAPYVLQSKIYPCIKCIRIFIHSESYQIILYGNSSFFLKRKTLLIGLHHSPTLPSLYM